ncbi:MAG: hypothetical protein ACREQE_04610, partial [Candidatus Binataceae bacterium]
VSPATAQARGLNRGLLLHTRILGGNLRRCGFALVVHFMKRPRGAKVSARKGTGIARLATAAQH